MKKITAKQAQSIIDIACNEWKKILSNRWAKYIVLGNSVKISDYFYKDMRIACTKKQHALFDTIFKEDIDFSILNDKDIFYLKSKVLGFEYEYLCKGGNPFEETVKGFDLKKEERFKNVCSTKDCIIEFRLATEEERELFELSWCDYKVGDYITCVEDGYNNARHPDYIYEGAFAKGSNKTQKIVKIEMFEGNLVAVGDKGGVARLNLKNAFRLATEEEINFYPYKDGELIFVKNIHENMWELRYTNGKLNNLGKILCYANQQKSGMIISWDFHAPTIKGFSLPKT